MIRRILQKDKHVGLIPTVKLLLSDLLRIDRVLLDEGIDRKLVQKIRKWDEKIQGIYQNKCNEVEWFTELNRFFSRIVTPHGTNTDLGAVFISDCLTHKNSVHPTLAAVIYQSFAMKLPLKHIVYFLDHSGNYWAELKTSSQTFYFNITESLKTETLAQMAARGTVLPRKTNLITSSEHLLSDYVSLILRRVHLLDIRKELFLMNWLKIRRVISITGLEFRAKLLSKVGKITQAARDLRRYFVFHRSREGHKPFLVKK